MIKQLLPIFPIALGCILFATSAQAHQFSSTNGANHLINWGDDLVGISYHDAEYDQYCNRYSSVAIRQANQRQRNQCTGLIPQSRGRWGKNKWKHKNWCLSVSARASQAEVITREGQLKSCINRQHPHRATPNPNSGHHNLRSRCIQNDRMHSAASRGDYTFVMRCLDAGVSPNIREGNGWTPLFSASRNGQYRIVQLLINRGANVNAQDKTGRTPMDQSIIGRHNKVTNLLDRNGGWSRD